MSRLQIYNEQGQRLADYRNWDEVATRLHAQGVQFERWPTQLLPVTATVEEVLAAYADSITTLSHHYAFQSTDLVALTPDHPQKAELRQKFLAEHIHRDFEIRFFVEGRGLFYLHLGAEVYLVECEQGDLISVPANTRHWFDMGSEPFFKSIRFFTLADGWVAEFTGDPISERFPTFDQVVAQ